MCEAVLNESRADLAARMAQLRVGELNYSAESNAEAWVIELSRLERQHGYACVEATIEYYIDCATEPESVPFLGESIYCYLESLFEWQMMAKTSDGVN